MTSEAKEGRFLIPVGGGDGAYHCLEYVKAKKIAHESITMLMVMDDVKGYNKASSKAKAEARLERQRKSLGRCLAYCRKNGVRSLCCD